LAQVKDEQSYIVLRERVHRNTAESTNARVKWWSIFQLAVLIGEGIFQVWWLKRFFEVSYETHFPSHCPLLGFFFYSSVECSIFEQGLTVYPPDRSSVWFSLRSGHFIGVF
jgi:hypothetical protein